MKKLVWAVCLVVSGAAFAQEIGTEIPADQQQTTTTGSQPTSYDNPYGQPVQATTPPPAASAQPAAAATAVPGPKKGEFGLRASFGGSAIPSVPASGSGQGGATPTIGMKFLASDSMAINFDVGLGMGFGSRIAFGFGVGFGIQAYMGSADKPIRPFFQGDVAFGKTLDATGKGWNLGIDVGFGGEYFFNDHFSLQGSALVGLPLNLDNLQTVQFATFQPGVGANFYF